MRSSSCRGITGGNAIRSASSGAAARVIAPSTALRICSKIAPRPKTPGMPLDTSSPRPINCLRKLPDGADPGAPMTQTSFATSSNDAFVWWIRSFATISGPDMASRRCLPTLKAVSFLKPTIPQTFIAF